MPWNEWLCLEFCRNLGLDSAKAEVILFDDKPVIVIERFDRVWHEGVIYRLPQEDMCQALSIPPFRKYEADGGPGIVDILNFLNGAINPYECRMAFTKTQIAYWLLAAIDGHAKNFSILLSPGGFRLAPLYDVASFAPWAELPDQKVKMAMAWGYNKHYGLNQIQLRHFYQTGAKTGLREPDIDGILSSILAQVDDAIVKTAAKAADSGVPNSTAEPILEGIVRRIRIIQGK
ncbi:MAG: type II toxin-antitoxin system HipA family toxin [Gammaproteobacteria bacterium]|nr:type II toxin-antitoxin system HipA family toxin [Gammaproteobacteria bacterium]